MKNDGSPGDARMEILWPVLAVMIPLFVGGVIALIMYWRRKPSRRRRGWGVHTSVHSAGGRKGGRGRLPVRSFAIGLSVAVGLAVAIVLAVFVGFPIIRSLLMAIHAPVDPG